MTKHDAGVSVLVAMTLLGATAAPAFAGGLSFEQRVACQRVVEKWRFDHRTGSRRSFEQVVPVALLQRKVRRYVRENQALEQIWHHAITTRALEREMSRIASGTLMPDRLRELYDALGGDPDLVLECVARPVLVDRLARNFFAGDCPLHACDGKGAAAGERASSGSGAAESDGFDEFQLRISWQPDFLGTITTGDGYTQETTYALSDQEWARACRKAQLSIYLEVSGRNREDKTNGTSSVVRLDVN